jgi:hypothetical protein
MFSRFAVYVGDKIVLMLRDSLNYPEENGIWLVFFENTNLADTSIRRDFPSPRLGLLGGKARSVSFWQVAENTREEKSHFLVR